MTDDSDMQSAAVIRAAVQVVATIGEAIKSAGADGVPSGHVYAVVMGLMSHQTYNAVIATLIVERLIHEDSFHVLRWIGPDPLTTHTFIRSIFPTATCALCDRLLSDPVHTPIVSRK